MTDTEQSMKEAGIPGRRAGCETSKQHRENLRAALIAFHTANGEAEARRNKLKSLIESGYSNQAAAEVFGTTKSAIGKMLWRMQKRGIVIKREPRIVQVAKANRARRLRGPVPPKPRKHIESPPMMPAGLLERTGCAFPVAYDKMHLFCNNEIHSPTSYCEFHGNLMVRSE